MVKFVDTTLCFISFFPEAKYFSEFERFDRYIDKLNRHNNGFDKIDYMSICSPNYLHDAHIRHSLRCGANVICEKPLVLNPWNIEGLIKLEKTMGLKVNTILQLRDHPEVKKLKKKISNNKINKKEIDITYITPRGNWYLQSWKGDIKKSGGIATNIGIHFFDLLHYLYGDIRKSIVYLNEELKSSGYLEFKNANVKWFLSIDSKDLPNYKINEQLKPYRKFLIDKKELDLSVGFNDLHEIAYKNILNGEGYGLSDTKNAIETVSKIRNSNISDISSHSHSFLVK